MIGKTLSFFSFLLLFSFSAEGQMPSLDLDFGSDGSTRFTVPEESTRGTDFLILNDNSTLVAVNSEIPGAFQNRGFYVYRIFENGQLDTDFGENGQLHFPHGVDGRSIFSRFELWPDGKILLKCMINGNSKLIRFNQGGELDNSFGENGIQDVIDGWNIGIQSNGKIIVQGQYWDGNINRYRFSRYHEDGSLDVSFGDDGIIIRDITDFTFDLCSSICILENDDIIAVGYSYDVGYDYHAVISRFDANGSLNSSFGNNGTIITSFNSSSDLGEFIDVEVSGDKIIVGGNYHYTGGQGGFGGTKPAVARFNLDGSYDTSFDEDGRVILETVFGANDRLRAIDVQWDEKIVIGGGTSYPYPQMLTLFYITRLNTNGSLDVGFGQNGVFTTDFNNPQSSSNYVTDLAIHGNSGLLAFGCTYSFSGDVRNAIICRIADGTIGFSEQFQDVSVNVFPNPTSDFVRITSKEAISKIEIYNTAGQLVKSEIFFDSPTAVTQNLKSLTPRTYQIIISTVGQRTCGKKLFKVTG
ncbi:MAG: T9SS type A sorting domain-containing protein [Flavobacteriales bacterium]|nr:T9SS type A sorting domain-containing protein [Flavobacteriales bacterium]